MFFAVRTHFNITNIRLRLSVAVVLTFSNIYNYSEVFGLL